MRSTGKIIPVLVSILAVALLSLSTQAFALDQNGIIQMPFTNNPPAIDGTWTTTDEWKDASVTTVTYTGNNIVYILSKHDVDNIYLMIDKVNEQSQSTLKVYREDKGVLDAQSFLSLNFDTNNDGSNTPDSDDYYFTNILPLNNYQIDTVVFNGAPKGNEVVNTPYNYRIEQSFSSNNDPYESGRNHRIYEIQIPILFLHKSDSYGLMIVTAEKNGKEIFWPKNSLGVNPSTFGSIKAPNQSITAPPVPVISVSTKSLSFGNEEISGKSSTQTVTISNSGTGVLKISNIQTPNEFSISGITTPIDVPPNQSMTFNVILAPISLGEKSGQITIYSNDPSNPASSISVSGTGVEKGKSPFGGKCLIATAAFGSELSPQVQFLRGFRDNHILATESGSSFMNVFNTWYYSFSPYVADYERQQPWLQEIVRTSIYPLLGILTLSEKGFSIVQGDYGAVVAGSIASSMIGAVYFWPLALIAKPVRNSTSKYNYKIALAIFGTTLTATIVSILSANQTALMITTSLFVLSLTAISATLSARYIVRVIRKLTNRNFLSEIHHRKA